MKKTLLSALLLALGLALVMISRTLLHRPRVVSVSPAPALEIDQRRVCERLGKALRIASVAVAHPDALQEARLQRSVEYLLDKFPPLVKAMQVERWPRSLVLRWQGSEPSLAPLLLLAHLDVVPVETQGEADWKFPPFSGKVAAGSIWGRGALDDKASALAMLEAAEVMIAAGGRPRRSVIFCFGLDEELGGERGARAQAARFAAEGLEPFLVLDEGFAVLDGVIEAVEAPVAGIGIAEKGSLTVRLRVEHDGGHASMPAEQSAIGILAAAIAQLERHPSPARIEGAAGLFFDELSRCMPFGARLLFANRWLCGPLLVKRLLQKPGTAALLRTTASVTGISAGTAPNVLPRGASAVVNLRIHPAESVAQVLEDLRRTIDDERVQIITEGQPSEPSRLSPTGGAAWTLLEGTIRECYAGVIVAPTLVIGATDARHFAELSPNIYRFNGLRLGPDDLERIHGIDERITTRNYLELIRFYLQLMRKA